MHPDELRTAVTTVVDTLNRANIRSVIDQYRLSKGEQRTAAAARLGHAGALIMERIDAMSAQERQVVDCLHLDTLGSAEYWQKLLGGGGDPKEHQAEVVRLASRIMFASSQLPGLVSLLGNVQTNALPVPQPDTGFSVQPLGAGESRLKIRLIDAGERASDPDRIARAIDGIDMLYSACASISRKPAMDLRLDGINGQANRDRDFVFTGERDGIAAVYAVIDSIPAALAEIDNEQDLDLDTVVESLPIFDDLNTLASLGTFSKKDLKDISDTMRQGALLVLESGVILIDADTENAGESSATPTGDQQASQAPTGWQQTRVVAASSEAAQSETPVIFAAAAQNPAVAPATAEKSESSEHDEHYDRYLREREAMLKSQAAINGHNGHAIPTLNSQGSNGVIASPQADDQARRDAVDELLKSLDQSRRS